MDQQRYFEDFPHSQLSVQNFSYVRRPLGLNNAAYEIIQKPDQNSKEPEGKICKNLWFLQQSDKQYLLLHTDFSLIVTFEASLLLGVLSNLGRGMRGSLSPSKFGRKTMGGASYKEVDETSGLLESESSEDEDEEVRLINGFDIALPVTLQANIHLTGR